MSDVKKEAETRIRGGDSQDLVFRTSPGQNTLTSQANRPRQHHQKHPPDLPKRPPSQKPTKPPWGSTYLRSHSSRPQSRSSQRLLNCSNPLGRRNRTLQQVQKRVAEKRRGREEERKRQRGRASKQEITNKQQYRLRSRRSSCTLRETRSSQRKAPENIRSLVVLGMGLKRVRGGWAELHYWVGGRWWWRALRLKGEGGGLWMGVNGHGDFLGGRGGTHVGGERRGDGMESGGRGESRVCESISSSYRSKQTP